MTRLTIGAVLAIEQFFGAPRNPGDVHPFQAPNTWHHHTTEQWSVLAPITADPIFEGPWVEVEAWPRGSSSTPKESVQWLDRAHSN